MTDKPKLHTPDFTEANIAKLAELFPSCVVEAKDEKTGELRRSIDFDQLRQELSDHVVEGPQERYRLDWPGKREALLAANAPIAKTLRPAREESVDFDTSQNLFIEGDNLDALKLLQETYLGKVKMIYIDPPYNTGRDFIYDDDFSMTRGEYAEETGERDEEGNAMFDAEKWQQNSSASGRFHSEWLSMIYPRLKLARNLLKDDGVLFISIDDGEASNLRRVCDEIFGAQNFVANIIWQKVFAPKNSATWISENHDHILLYAKSKQNWRPNPLPQTEEMLARYKNPDKDERGPWQSDNLTARNRYDAGLYSVTCPSGRVIDGPPKGSYWRVNENKFKELDADGRIWWGEDGNNMPRLKRYLSEVKSGKTPETIWTWKEVGHTQDAKKELLKYIPFNTTENVLNSVKPVDLIKQMLRLATNPGSDDLVLDFFSGSAPTAHGVVSLNFEDGGRRRFIGVQISEPLPKPELKLETIFDMGLARVRSFRKEVMENATTSADLDIGFRVLKVDTSNVKDIYYRPDQISQDELGLQVDHIKEDRSAEDILFQVMLDWGVDLSLPVKAEAIAGKTVHFVDENAIAACFETGIDEAFVKELAKRQPLRAVFRDSGFADDAMKINVKEIFKQLSPGTEIKTL